MRSFVVCKTDSFIFFCMIMDVKCSPYPPKKNYEKCTPPTPKKEKDNKESNKRKEL